MSVSSNLKISVSRAFWRAVGGDSSGGAERERCRTEELKRLEVLRNVDRRGLPVRAAARLLGRSERQVWRLLKGFLVAGVSGLISKKRGRLEAALCQGLRARPPPDPKQRTTDTSKMEKKLTSVFCVDNAVGARSKCHPDS